MVDVIVKKTEKLSGEVCAPASKSYTQRMLIAAGDGFSQGLRGGGVFYFR